MNTLSISKETTLIEYSIGYYPVINRLSIRSKKESRVLSVALLSFFWRMRHSKNNFTRQWPSGTRFKSNRVFRHHEKVQIQHSFVSVCQFAHKTSVHSTFIILETCFITNKKQRKYYLKYFVEATLCGFYSKEWRWNWLLRNEGRKRKAGKVSSRGQHQSHPTSIQHPFPPKFLPCLRFIQENFHQICLSPLSCVNPSGCCLCESVSAFDTLILGTMGEEAVRFPKLK